MNIKWMIAAAAMSIATVVAAGCSGVPSMAQAQAAGAPAAVNNGDNGAPPSASTGAAPAARQGSSGQTGARRGNSGNFTAGQVQQINGNTIQLTTANNGTVTIQTTDETQVQKLGPGGIADIQQGEMILAQGTKASDGTFSAQTIRLGGRGGNAPRPGSNGQGGLGGQGQPGANGQNGGRQFNPNNVAFGQVSQVNGSTIELSTPNNGTLKVTVSDQTRIEKMVQAGISDIQTGERISAQGTRASDGSFTAQMIQIGGTPGQGRSTPGATASN